MKRVLTAMVTGLVAVGMLTGCSKSEEERCEESYKDRQEQLTGSRPSEREADRACDRNSSRYYGGSGYRGGGSGSGK